ncbi:2-succinyl-5-enolpyruvyl-6-hydroxy-3-cyclohexene-1-carboxylate synthase [Lacunisphaera limnophila]|uniref:2-succinyl-5-enolpyruvyl-6-hydroxy-3-cyclohexene-1-carboxylate synthase n=1 Tax=Lacunisphaera limnophila TaxID=1838286 RepID=A0A1D8AWX3_9BACT|nr:2-succinyl-5-enolpyruvyl-6-hydroxy-3-cyclohexene-1-carboxylic-acid synthase [Lacunisphaera limnophila]AOS45381.1 2-succinyl-5-enolpyruvyl-6-hydroxy-3-cyclohexene-1-carboxylate synthase [Lacunisphaera limnophila]
MKSAADPQLDYRNTNTLWCSVLVGTLVRLGLRHAVISPGSRSAPLTIALARHPEIESLAVLDERSAGFYALGLAKQHRRPVALVCTSGTAAANFLPAVVEAHESGVPLLVLTADRPPEMRDCHSGQTIDQVKLYGAYVNFQHECAVPEATVPLLRYLRQTVAHAVERTLRPAAGPVHLNCPFRDPLPPLPDNATLPRPAALQGLWEGLAPAEALEAGAGAAPAGAGRRWAERGVIIVGPNESVDGEAWADAVGRISRALGWPVLADALAPVRANATRAGAVITRYDTLLRNDRLAAELHPVQVICVGGWPTSKVLRGWLQAADPEVVLVTDRTGNEDALHLRTRVVRGPLAAWSEGFAGRTSETAWVKAWLRADARAGRALVAGVRAERGLIEPVWPGILATHLPARTPCFIASSMPVRDAEYFWPAGNRGQRLFFNRGANGIDGTLSTALGAVHGGPPGVLVTGDLSLLHDTNGFLSVPKFRGSLTIVLINNNGGGIFEHLPVAQFEPPFEEFFGTPQNIDFRKLCATYDVAHTVVRSAAHLGRLVAKLPKSGVRVLELRTERKRDAAWRKQLFARVAG